MCLIIHKPAGIAIPHGLLAAATQLNRDGWGAMGFQADGDLLMERQMKVELQAVLAFEQQHRGAEYVLHLRRRTRGSNALENVHPFRVVPGVYLMHNGTLPLEPKRVERSDTWHLVSEILRPLAQRHISLLSDPAFLQLLELGLKPENKLALLHEATREIVLVNWQHGAELDGLWLSSTRWIDRGRFPLVHAPQPQERVYSSRELHFL
ncbi:MAG TPA: class II glutamine amidotransferase [Solimonas sp.]|nr:class II glutamine amidotransferase [Solimonas sp.]